jgi:hypothetical protein
MKLFVPPILWYENEQGEKFIPDLTKDEVVNPPAGFIYQHSQFPKELVHNCRRSVVREEVDQCPHPAEDVHKTYGWIEGIEGRECSRCHGTQIKNIGDNWPDTWDANGSRTVISGNSSWPEDLVLAMATYETGRFRLSDAILIAANACERCMNALAYNYGLSWGYPEGSDEWKRCNTTCKFCKDEK